MLLLSVGLLVAGPVPVALAAAPTVHAPVVTLMPQSEGDAPTEDAETFDGSAHDAQLADTGAQRTLLLTIGGLLSVGAGLTAWWVSRRSTSRH
ncbi:LPXTG cell wall anchor domain-containing protein [Enteractinococcus helveticum]|uniref:Gram-positive cocci surface proteins LPxTG domain-containing protein n=1 Tax=Enteractinococcus helveticum TaxID=1837282 RepID=A0A1B7M0Q8_9MICC|nr:LPXTG cell wall anchor domain-containing protein [Enteractinococcus helveticum]OAV61769.1 hypothetical protein A6F49_07695 [Enteractinococcus helveticum]